MKKELLLFCSKNYKNINKDLIDNKFNLFDEVKLLNDDDLDNYIKLIVNNIIEKYGTRGYGYWIWKPYIILKELDNLQEGDILVHLDMHCHLDKIKDRFDDIVKELDNKHIILGLTGFNEYKFTTTKLRKYIEKQLNYKFSEEEFTDFQFEGGINFIKNCEFSRNFIRKWFELMLNGLEYISDKYNTDSENYKEFIDNRHDQSVVSLLAKYYKIKHSNISYSDLH